MKPFLYKNKKEHHSLASNFIKFVTRNNFFKTIAVLFSLTLFCLHAGSGILEVFIKTIEPTEKKTQRKITIGDNTIHVSENMIPNKKARRDGRVEKLDIYVHWPDMNGYSKKEKDDFNYASKQKRILFITFKKTTETQDTNKSWSTIYHSLLESRGRQGPGGLRLYSLKQDSGYINEEFAINEKFLQYSFIARCLKKEDAKKIMADCKRDIQINDTLTLSYRFSQDILSQWPQLDASILRMAKKMIKEAKNASVF